MRESCFQGRARPRGPQGRPLRLSVAELRDQSKAVVLGSPILVEAFAFTTQCFGEIGERAALGIPPDTGDVLEPRRPGPREEPKAPEGSNFSASRKDESKKRWIR